VRKCTPALLTLAKAAIDRSDPEWRAISKHTKDLGSD
jgi:hypothetical protein